MSKKSTRRYFERRRLDDDPSLIYLYRQVASLHAQGTGKKAIAEELSISFWTVRDILREITRDETIRRIIE
jgi:DNA-binding NarL/FixJ family response regulator